MKTRAAVAVAAGKPLEAFWRHIMTGNRSLRMLAAAIVAASNNVQDPFIPTGMGDLLKIVD